MVFLFLIPGLIFRVGVFFNSPVKRPIFSGNTFFSSIVILLYSVSIQFFSILVLLLLLILFNLLPFANIELSIIENANNIRILINDQQTTVFNFIFSNQFLFLIYLILLIFISFALAIFVRFLSFKIRPIGKLLYGPLASLINSSDYEFITCFVVTKITHDQKIIMYAGYATEIGLKDGSNIDHIVIEDPEKFYLTLNDKNPKTNYNNPRSLSSDESMSGIMYISGDEIQNVYFESWYFN